MSSRARSRTGQVLGKTYRIERLLGVGSLGAVYVARHVRTGALCAVKLLHRKLLPDTEAYQKFVEETRTLGVLRHPHILLFSDHDQDEAGGMYLVMELLEGETLHQRLQQRGSLTVLQVLDLVRQVGGALHAAHRTGVVHRNLRPENIFLVRHDMGDHVTESLRVMDFGLGRLRRLPQVDGAGPLLGVSQYTAPETIAGTPPDARADQWALAVVMYRALAGRLPFDGDSLREVVRQMMEQAPVPLQQVAPEVPAALAGAIARGLQRDPRERFDTVMDLVRAACDRPTLRSGVLAAPSGPLPSLSPTSEELPRPVAVSAPPAPRGSRALLMAGVALTLLASGGVTAWLLHERAEGLATSLAAPAPPEPPPPGPAPAEPSPLQAPGTRPAQEAAPSPAAPAEPPPAAAVAPSTPPSPASVRASRRSGGSRPAEPVPAEPPPSPGEPPAPPEEPPPPGEPAGKLLEQAQAAYAEGDRARAISLALAAAHRGGGRAAWRFLASAACQVRDARLATRAYRHLEEEDRTFVLGLCRRQQLEYVDGEFRAESWTTP